MKEKEEILARTSGGLDIFVHYLGKGNYSAPLWA